MDASDKVLTAVAEALREVPAAARLSVAFSGGMDSSVLLEAVRRAAVDLDRAPPRALMVDHGLSPEAPAWHAHAVRWCGARGICVQRLEVSVPLDSGGGLEEAARTARYAALAGALETGEFLCVAHHADDQAETVLLNLLRGSGSLGTGAMQARRELAPGVLLRPLLGLERTVLAQCARDWGLVWVCDPANARLEHARNRLRHVVMPALRAINPQVVAAVCHSATLNQESTELAGLLSLQDLTICARDRSGDRTGAGPRALARGALLALPAARRRAVLRLWCRRSGVTVPGRAHLEEMDRQIRSGGRDRTPTFALGPARLVVHGDEVRLLKTPRTQCQPGGALSWSPESPLRLHAGTLSAEPVRGAGLRPGAPLEIRYRVGGERCRPAGRRHSQTLKRLYQEYRVPPWAREGRPLLYRDGILVGVAGLFVCQGHEVQQGETGWVVHWQVDAEGGC